GDAAACRSRAPASGAQEDAEARGRARPRRRVSEPGEPEIDVPPQLAGGAFANDVYVYDDPEHVTIDFVRLDPRDPGTGVVVARLVDHACDIRDRPVRVVLIPEQELPARVELLDEVSWREPGALAVLDRDHQPLPRLAARRERRVVAGDAHGDVAADERERRVLPKHARQQSRFAQDLETVARAEHESAVAGVARDR